MQQILAFTRKEFRLWAQRPGSWIIIFVVPLIFIWIMQAVFGSSGTPVITIYAVDEDQSPRSERLIEALGSSENLDIEVLEKREEASQQVSAGRHMAAVIIPKGFALSTGLPGGAEIEIMIDPARSEQASIVTGLVNAAISREMIDAEVNREIEDTITAVTKNLPSPTPAPENSEEGSSPDAQQGQGSQPVDPVRAFFAAAQEGVVASQVEQALTNPQVTIDAQPFELEDGQAARQPSLLDYLVPGYSLMFVFFLISNIATTVIEERQVGALRRLMVTPVPRSRILLGKMLPYFLIAVLQFVVILLASKLIFGIDLGNSPLALAIIILAVSLSMAALGILISAFAQSEGQAGGLTTILVLAMAVVSGAMFPTISIPGLKALTPHYWAMQGFINTIARGQGVEGVLLPAGVLITMAAVFFTIGAMRFQFE